MRPAVVSEPNYDDKRYNPGSIQARCTPKKTSSAHFLALEDLPSPQSHTDRQVFWLPDHSTDRAFPARLQKMAYEPVVF
jgi:hypothetical protein